MPRKGHIAKRDVLPPLPFFSSGGSSVIVSLLAAGFLINVSRADNKYVREFEYER